MIANTMEHNQLIDRYVRGDLDAAEMERFEDYFFDQPQVIAEIEAAQALKFGLKKLPNPVARHRWRWLEWLFQPAHTVPLFGAYAVLVCALGVSLAWHLVDSSATGERSSVLRNVPVYYLEVRRSIDAKTQIRLHPKQQQFLLSLDIYPGYDVEQPVYTVRVYNQVDAALVREIQGLMATDNAINLVFDRAALPAGEYRLQVSSTEAPEDAPLQTYHFAISD